MTAEGSGLDDLESLAARLQPPTEEVLESSREESERLQAMRLELDNVKDYVLKLSLKKKEVDMATNAKLSQGDLATLLQLQDLLCLRDRVGSQLQALREKSASEKAQLEREIEEGAVRLADPTDPTVSLHERSRTLLDEAERKHLCASDDSLRATYKEIWGVQVEGALRAQVPGEMLHHTMSQQSDIKLLDEVHASLRARLAILRRCADVLESVVVHSGDAISTQETRSEFQRQLELIERGLLQEFQEAQSKLKAAAASPTPE
jgi:hypothetical protein